MGAYDLYTSSYQAPNFPGRRAAVHDDGRADQHGGHSKAVPTRTETLRTAFSVPVGTMPSAGWPVILYALGSGGDSESFFDDGTAGRFAAVIAECGRHHACSLRRHLHRPSARRHALPGRHRPRHRVLQLQQHPRRAGQASSRAGLRRLQTAAPRPEASIEDPACAPRRQRALQAGCEPRLFLRPLGGQPDGRALRGAEEPLVKAAIFSGAGAGLVSSLLLEKMQPGQHRARSCKTSSTSRSTTSTRCCNLLQGFFDESDPANYARRYFLAEAARGPARPRASTCSLGLRDSYAPDPTIENFALAVGVAPVGQRPRPASRPDLLQCRAEPRRQQPS